MSIIKQEFEDCLEMHKNPFPANFSGCSSNFDDSLCWSRSNAGERAQRLCPFTYCPAIPGCQDVAETHVATRVCDSNGQWAESDYGECLAVVQEFSHCIQGYCRVCPDLLRDVVISVSLTLSIVSVALLVAAILLFSIFDSLQCRRLSIHKNLATAFVFRFAVLAIWTIVQTTNLFQDCTKFYPQPLRQFEWVCKMILWFVIYFQVASVMWMLIEGAYLLSRFTIFAMRQSEKPWSMYMACGWGVPFIVVMCWTIVHHYKSSLIENSFCWVPYASGSELWILALFMGFALITNLIFLLVIVIILVLKLRVENASESKKIWRTIKATLLLVPLLGISNIPLFYEPERPSAFYMLGSAILQHSQGIFIAVLYCFLNGEIQTAVKRQLSKVPFEFFKQKQRFETERTYVPENRALNAKHGVPMEELNATMATNPTRVAGETSQTIFSLSTAPSNYVIDVPD